MTAGVAHLTRRDVPDGSLIGVYSDVHIGIEDREVLGPVVECSEREGVTHVWLNGDIHDCGVASRHPDKRARAALDHGRLAEEAAGGRWFVDWALTRHDGAAGCIYGEGNHEDWINQIALDPALNGTVTVRSALGLPNRLVMLPQGYQIRLGSLRVEHGDAVFKRGSGGKYPARKLLDVSPDQTTLVGHVHRMDDARRVYENEDGVLVSRRAHTQGHLSLPHKHRDYAARNPSWHQSFTFIRVFWDGARPKYTLYPVEVFRNRRGRPAFEFNGRLYG